MDTEAKASFVASIGVVQYSELNREWFQINDFNLYPGSKLENQIRNYELLRVVIK